MTKTLTTIIIWFALHLVCSPSFAAQQNDPMAFDDYPLTDELDLPNWFNLSFLDLQDSLDEAMQAGKRGLIIYFGRKDCAYCKALLEGNWGSKDIRDYTIEHFHVIAIDVRGQRTVTDFDGKTYTEKEFSARMRTDFTPSLLFYDRKGQLALRLPGYRPIYQFRAALEYVADAHYYKEPFRHYLARAEEALSFGQEELNEHDAFMSPPYNLDRSKTPGNSPLAVFFEHPRCHACDILHGGPMSNPEVGTNLHNMDVVQINTASNTQVITPAGKKTTARQWADDLELNFAPTIIFFDPEGKEILRIESVVRLYRLNNVLVYVLGKGYEKYPTFQIWRDQLNR
ncbi:MAG: thioredoxin fold domain-containing protein [Gammaproteobacteria bacterium]|nr:thioredoxin fold domain-containing protein [Gammaproteobacteria bacterium]